MVFSGAGVPACPRPPGRAAPARSQQYATATANLRSLQRTTGSASFARGGGRHAPWRSTKRQNIDLRSMFCCLVQAMTVDSRPDDVAFVVRCVLAGTRPVVVRSLLLVTVVVAVRIVAVSPSKRPNSPRPWPHSCP